MSQYRKGRRFEYLVRDHLRKLGWTVFRLAGSKPLDLVAVRQGKVVFVECKFKKPTKKEIEKVEMFAALLQLPVFLHYKDEDGTIVSKRFLADGKSYIPDFEPFEPEIELYAEGPLAWTLPWTTEKIFFGDPVREFESLIEVIVTHEELHKVIYRLEGYKTTIDFDNVFGMFHPSIFLMPEDFRLPFSHYWERVWKWWRRNIRKV